MSLALTKILGLPLVAWGGLTVLTLVAFQVASGLRLVKFNQKYHKWIGISILALGLVHGTLGLMVLFG